MHYMRKVWVMVFICVLISIAVSHDAYGWRWQLPRRGAGSAARTAASHKRLDRKYRYIDSHDFNHDGKVNLNDRLLLLNKNKDSYATVYISEDNEDLYEAMDADGDGDVEPAEMKIFYEKYDLNKNGVLEEEEVEAAAE